MSQIKLLAIFLLLTASIVGCDKKASIDGKVVDGRGKSLAGITIIARQSFEGKDAIELETKSDEGGIFRFSNLSPDTRTELIAFSDNHFAESEKVVLERLQEKQASALLELRFDAQSEDIVVDTKRELMWTRNVNLAITPMDWDTAMKWVQGLNYAGYSDWRLPTHEELESSIKIVRQKWIIRRFANVQPYGIYWSSTPCAIGSSSRYAWFVLMMNAGAGSGEKSVKYLAWPVRDVGNRTELSNY